MCGISVEDPFRDRILLDDFLGSDVKSKLLCGSFATIAQSRHQAAVLDNWTQTSPYEDSIHLPVPLVFT